MKAIVYHYVREDDPLLPEFRFLHINDFRRQLDYFESEFGFVSLTDFEESFRTGEIPTGIVLTFDDGLIDHYSYVFPELRKRGLWGIFYVPTLFLDYGRMMDVHKIHLLLGHLGGKDLLERVRASVDDDMVTHDKVQEFRELTYRSTINDEATVLVKRILNYYISFKHRERILDQILTQCAPSLEERRSRFYATREQLVEMAQGGMILGGHSISHRVMSRLSPDEQTNEVVESLNTVATLSCPNQFKTFCYPYGGFHSFNNTSESIVTEVGCLFSFNVEPRDVSPKDVMQRPQALPRYDCNMFPYGQCRNLEESAKTLRFTDKRRQS